MWAKFFKAVTKKVSVVSFLVLKEDLTWKTLQLSVFIFRLISQVAGSTSKVSSARYFNF